MLIKRMTPDPSWQVEFRRRNAILWIGPNLGIDRHSDLYADLLRCVTASAWAAVYVDSPQPTPTDVAAVAPAANNLEIRTFVSDAGAEHLPPNRLPIYFLRGPQGTVFPNSTSDPAGMFLKYTMLQRAVPSAGVFVIGVKAASDLAGLSEAARLSAAFHRLALVAPPEVALNDVEPVTDSIVHWQADLRDMLTLVADAVAARAEIRPAQVFVQTETGRVSVDVSSCIDPSYPITDVFEPISADDVLAQDQPTENTLSAFLADPTASWTPYALGVPYPRHRDYERSLVKYLHRFSKEGPILTATAWINAEDGSGATTTLRQLCFNVAREGFPTLVARPQADKFDFKQLSTFLARAADRMAKIPDAPLETPWVVAFDAQHTQLHEDFVLGLANGLKNLMRQVVVVVVQPTSAGSEAGKRRAQGNNRVLGGPLSASVSVEEGIDVGKYLSRFAPSVGRTSDAEWRTFVSDTVRISSEGTRSLFWVALRFWLGRLPGAETSLRKWLATKLESAVASSSTTYAALLEIAALAKHRIPTPLVLLDLDAPARQALRSPESDALRILGLRCLSAARKQQITFSHPLIADEILRIAKDDSFALESIEMATCVGLLDLELHLLGRILARPTAGLPESLATIEEVVTNALRVDPREAPRNFQARDQIVRMLEKAPDTLWDTSQVFNHHLAKARRHLAGSPPNSDWTLPARAEQCELAEEHLRDAIYNVTPIDEEHRESELNLRVSLALTLDVHARLEEEIGNAARASELRRLSEQEYLSAQRLDADNSFVLENYARFKLWRARELPVGRERTHLIVDAIVLIELERDLDDVGHRDLPTLEVLATAYTLLDEGGGEQSLSKLAAMGSESAMVALARLAIRRAKLGELDEATALAQAADLLGRVKGADATWLTYLTHYQVVSRQRPFDFSTRVEILESLDADQTFNWPKQLRMEYAILLFQAGDSRKRTYGAEAFREIREDLARSGALSIPDEMRFLRDPAVGYTKALRTHIVVTKSSEIGRSSYGIPSGWGTIEVPFRGYRFGRDTIRRKDELDCIIQFSNFGPQAVPVTMEE